MNGWLYYDRWVITLVAYIHLCIETHSRSSVEIKHRLTFNLYRYTYSIFSKCLSGQSCRSFNVFSFWQRSCYLFWEYLDIYIDMNQIIVVKTNFSKFIFKKYWDLIFRNDIYVRKSHLSSYFHAWRGWKTLSSVFALFLLWRCSMWSSSTRSIHR